MPSPEWAIDSGTSPDLWCKLDLDIFTMKRWQWALLIFELALFAIILILPQVDLPDFTFHNGTAPVAAHARVSAPPIRTAIVTAAPVLFPVRSHEAWWESRNASAPLTLDYRLSSLCTLTC